MTRYSKVFILFALVFLVVKPSFSQDTLKFMHYNLLGYGVNGSGCPGTSSQNVYLNIILPEIAPDIFTVNEMGSNSSLHAENILVNVLDNIQGKNYDRATYVNNSSNSGIVNTMFYNSDKLILNDEEVINHSLRDINYYSLYYKDANLGSGADTSWLNVVVIHFKAGSSTSDKSIRTSQSDAIMAYLDGIGKPGNYFLAGDFNMGSSSETAYLKLVSHSNPDTKMYDPINKPGTWSSNASMAAYHTQSTRKSNSMCGSAGGMDDRFDQILVSDYVRQGTAKVTYISGSYKAFGNDGNHYNDDINGNPPPNTAVSQVVANALFDMSDHLPVVLEVEVDGVLASQSNDLLSSRGIIVKVLGNPFGESLELRIIDIPAETGKLKLELRDLAGKVVMQKDFQSPNKELELSLSTSKLPSGLYILNLGDKSGDFVTKKLIKR